MGFSEKKRKSKLHISVVHKKKQQVPIEYVLNVMKKNSSCIILIESPSVESCLKTAILMLTQKSQLYNMSYRKC